jgi:colicin import membrane protein
MRIPSLFASVAILLAGTACKDAGQGSSGQKPGATATDQVQADQKNAQKDLKRAEDAQKKAADEQAQATRAQKDVQDAQKKLTEAQQDEQKQRAEAQQAQARAQQEGKSAQEQASQAQQKAAQAQQWQAAAAQPSQGEQTVTGRATQVSSSEVVLDAASPSRIKVNEATQVTVDGQSASVAQIPQGSEIRASYRMDGGEATAIRIEVKTK